MANIINYDLIWQEIGRYARKVGRTSARPVFKARLFTIYMLQL